MSSLIIPAKRGEKFVVLIKKDNWWIIKSLKQLDGKVTKVRKNEFLFERSFKVKFYSGMGTTATAAAKIIFFYTYIWKKADHTKGFVWCVCARRELSWAILAGDDSYSEAMHPTILGVWNMAGLGLLHHASLNILSNWVELAFGLSCWVGVTRKKCPFLSFSPIK